MSHKKYYRVCKSFQEWYLQQFAKQLHILNMQNIYVTRKNSYVVSYEPKCFIYTLTYDQKLKYSYNYYIGSTTNVYATLLNK